MTKVKAQKAPKTQTERSEIAQRAVETRRAKHPGGTTERLSSVKVLELFARRNKFTTLQVMERTSTAKDNVTAVCAVLVGQKAIAKSGLGKDGSTQWQWID